MPDRMKINDQITLGAQPSEAELKAMSQDGVKTVINLRTRVEDLQPLDPAQEGAVVREHGMGYHHLPVSMKSADASLVDRFRACLDSAEKPVFVHCKLGKRAGAFVMMDHAVRQGWSGQDTLDRAAEMGFECDNEDLASFVRDYVDEHPKETGATS
jgi:uncharacterized protein (TIGR01244 family)